MYEGFLLDVMMGVVFVATAVWIYKTNAKQS